MISILVAAAVGLGVALLAGRFADRMAPLAAVDQRPRQ